MPSLVTTAWDRPEAVAACIQRGMIAGWRTGQPRRPRNRWVRRWRRWSART
ncbi:hypothetical protein I553_1921 [Mycobacterium xenopi 4042]|uniref:Uncharacterized protein n=1 Tax=Mycobacterium xenopi 4042 TaxID=1299334 RepID=X8DM13_MYCXE|nr:hypothetical protein I553_1921 [Mycobacterium xenopi 4042]